MKACSLIRICLVILLFACRIPVVQADQPDWVEQKVHWRLSGGDQITAIRHPQQKPVTLLNEKNKRRARIARKKIISPEKISEHKISAESLAGTVFANVFDSPPLNGFTPMVVISVTDKRYSEIDSRYDAVPSHTVEGSYPAPVDPQSDYAIGIFDTGASAHVIGNTAAERAGLFYPNTEYDLVTSNLVEIRGVNDSVEALVSQPLGLYIDGFGAVGPNGLLLDNSGMAGEWNVAIAVGQGGSPDLVTAVGIPLSVYYTTAVNNGKIITITKDETDFNSPDIVLYDPDDTTIPAYNNIIHMQLRPLGGVNVQYIPTFNEYWEFEPSTPSVIIGNQSQSLFFIRGVDFYKGKRSSTDDNAFMFDTGAQVTVIGSRIAMDHLGLNPRKSDFEIVITGVTGSSTIAPGFYIDTIDIPAFPEWLSYTNVPIIILDIDSPEGGKLDGIIGTNLFNDFDLLLRGGGLYGQDDPTLEFQPIGCPTIGDIAPNGGDCKVDYLDLEELADHWLQTSTSPGWNQDCDMAPQSTPDGRIDFLDFVVLAEHWLEGV